MSFDYKNHYRALISDLTNVLKKSIEMMPESDKDTPPDSEDGETASVQYSIKKKNKQKPLTLD